MVWVNLKGQTKKKRQKTRVIKEGRGSISGWKVFLRILASIVMLSVCVTFWQAGT